MLKQVKYMILVNLFGSFFYIIGNYTLWNRVNFWVLSDVASKWSPFFITTENLSGLTLPSSIFHPIFNYPFWTFWFLLAINMYFLIVIGRSKETKQNPS